MAVLLVELFKALSQAHEMLLLAIVANLLNVKRQHGYLKVGGPSAPAHCQHKAVEATVPQKAKCSSV